MLGAGGAVGGQTGGAGYLTVTNSASLATGGFASLGAYAGSTGSATISAAGAWSIGTGLAVGQSGSGTLSVSSASVTDGGSAAFGQTGSGTLTVNGGSFTASGLLTLGLSAGGFGTATVSSGLINAAGGIQVGASGTGLMTVASGGIVQIGTGSDAVGLSAGSNGTLLIQAGGTVASTQAPSTLTILQIGQSAASASQATANGAVIVTGVGARLDLNTHGLAVGQQGVEALTVANGATVAAGLTDTSTAALTGALGVGGNPQMTVTGAGSALNLGGIANFGLRGTAVLSVTSGGVFAIGNAVVSAPRLQIGFGQGANGGATGAVTVASSGTITDAGAINIGGSGSSGSLSISGGGSVQAAGTVTVGTALLSLDTVYGGNGALNIGAGGTLSSTAAAASTPLLVIAGENVSITGASDLSNGAVTVSGTGALLNTGGNAIAVGQAGVGSLTVQQHGTVLAGIGFVSNSAIIIGTTLGASGTVTVTDAGSNLTSVGQLTVGLNGQGLLVVSNPGTVITGGNTIDAGAGIDIASGAGSGGILLAGHGSLLSNTGRFIVGDGGVGNLTAAAGAVTLAAAAGSDGIVTVQGTGSALSLTGALTVGGAATGELSVLGGATITAANLLIGTGGAASTGNVKIGGAGSHLVLTGSTLAIGATAGGGALLTIGAGATLTFNGAITETGKASLINNGGTIDPDTVTYSGGPNSMTGALLVQRYIDTAGGNLAGSGISVQAGTGAITAPMLLFGTSVADAQINIGNATGVGVWTIGQGGTLVVNANTVDAGPIFDFGTGNTNSALVIGQTVDGYVAGNPDVGVTGTDPTIAVEQLQAGDLVQTWSGQSRRTAWVGMGRTLVTPRNRCDVTPVIVRAGALAIGVPSRDLHVTRHHALLVQDVALAVEHLINDASVIWDERAQVVEYHHLELDAHDILVADSAPAESFRDDGNANQFQNRATREASAPMPPCRPVVESGAQLDRAWAHVAALVPGRKAVGWTADFGLHLVVDDRRVEGIRSRNGTWSFDLPEGFGSISIGSHTTIPAIWGARTFAASAWPYKK